ncbi:helix-turn-helix transcriptional regulator [Micromonospora sp. NPDC049274]|uniref:helix-turn-helix domain-containing protein n=1 Tax=Micromonospora sp. NPDC049274 TaxID=3154829 RepID=UPI0034218B88
MPKRITPPADPQSGPVAQFGYELRQLRQGAQLTYAAIAQSGYYSRSALHAVDQGHQLPGEKLLTKFVEACGEQPGLWLARRAKIHSQLTAEKQAVQKTSSRELGLPPPDPTTSSGKLEYNDALKRLREWSGKTFREIAEITKTYPRRAPASTLCAAFQRGTLPARDLTESFLRATGLDESQVALWLKVWDDLAAGRTVKPEPTWRRWRTGAQTVLAMPHVPTPTVMPVTPYSPTNDVRDWVLVEGEWRATDENGNVTDKRVPGLLLPGIGVVSVMGLLIILWVVLSN